MGNSWIIPPENRAMQYIVTINQYRNITHAAEALYISQPSLSKFLKNLEARLGFNIFNRVGNKMFPTKEGEVYIEYAKRICEMESIMSNELTAMLTENRGRIRVALPFQRSTHIIPYVIPEFHKKYPAVEIRIYERQSKFLKQMLLDGSLDFAILNTTIESPNIQEETVLKDELLLAVPQDHPLRFMSTVSPDSKYPKIDLELFRDEVFILQPSEQRTRQMADQLFADAKITPKILFVTQSIETALRTVSQGAGACFVAETYTKSIQLQHQPVYFSINNANAYITLNLAYIKNVFQPAYSQDFIRILCKALINDQN